MTDFVDHNLIKNNELEKREYQDHLSEIGSEESTLIVLPTGTGKTIVTLRITANKLMEEYGGTSLLLAPTKPLVEQHYETYTNLLDIMDDEIIKFSGDVRPKKREELWEDNPSVVISTPQVIENDLISNRISLDNVIHLTIDECHRGTGEYSYVYVADKYVEQRDEPLITGLTASPGDNKEDILNICNNINVDSIEIITEDDPLIEPYIYDTEIETRFIDISDEVLNIRDTLQEVYKDRLQDLYEDDFVDSRSKTLSQKKLNKARGRIQQDMQKGNDNAYQAMSIWAEAMKLNTAIQLLETQGVDAFLDYYQRLEDELRSDDSSRAVERLVSDTKIQKAINIARNFEGQYKKIEVLKSELVNCVKINGGKSLVFTKSRDTVEILKEKLSSDFKVGRLVGQTDKKNSDGMTQKEQKEAVNKFSRGEYEVLISTQIGEEGLDISEVDLVVFYEPATKGIEKIQRQGRTGRTQKGRVVMLVGNQTRDKGMYYKSKNNVDQMKSDVSDLQEIENLEKEIQDKLQENKAEQKTLEESFEDISEQKESNDENIEDNVSLNSSEDDKPNIIADSRETNSSVVKNLDVDTEVKVDIEQNMKVGDYVVGENCVVERKSTEDFCDTLTGDRSLFEQISNMSNSYKNPVLLLEGEKGSLYTRNISRNAINGAIASIISDYNASVVHSVDEEDTARQLKSLAVREQDDEDSVVNPHGNKETNDISSQLEYITGSIEQIGPKTARNLLNEFETVKSIFNAEVEDLKRVDGVGEETAKTIYSIVRTKYNDS